MLQTARNLESASPATSLLASHRSPVLAGWPDAIILSESNWEARWPPRFTRDRTQLKTQSFRFLAWNALLVENSAALCKANSLTLLTRVGRHADSTALTSHLVTHRAGRQVWARHPHHAGWNVWVNVLGNVCSDPTERSVQPRRSGSMLPVTSKGGPGGGARARPGKGRQLGGPHSGHLDVLSS